METKRINEAMHKLEEIINYKFDRIDLLANAMHSKKVSSPNAGKNRKEYENETLAIVGDTLLKFIISDKLFSNSMENNKKIAKGEMTKRKAKLENNKLMDKFIKENGIIKYAYNDKHFFYESNLPKHEKVVSKKHNPYLEAIIGAIYYDAGYDITRKWILEWLIPKLDCLASNDNE